MNTDFETDVVIIGAGISGLTAGHYLKQQGARVCILEKAPRIGGAVHSERRDGFLVEYGPSSILDTTPLLHEMFVRLQIDKDIEYANDEAKKRYILRDGKLGALPASPLKFLGTKLFSASAKLRLMKEPFIKAADPDVDESLAEFVQRRLGQEFLDYAINPFVAGVYAGKPETLSVRSAFPRLHKLEQDYGSLIKGAILGARKRRKSKETSKSEAGMFSFRNGLQTLIDALGRDLDGGLFTNMELESVRRRDGVFDVKFDFEGQKRQVTARTCLITVPAYVYPSLPLDFHDALTEDLEPFYYPPVSMVYFGFSRPPDSVPLDGFGYLIPEKEQRNTLGTLWNSIIFSNRAPENGVALTTFVGGSRQPENARLPEEKLIDLVRADLRDIMGIQAEPDLVVIKKWQKAIPQYKVGHQKIMEKVEQFEAAYPGCFVSGNFRGGISVADCVKQSHLMSEHIHEFLS